MKLVVRLPPEVINSFGDTIGFACPDDILALVDPMTAAVRQSSVSPSRWTGPKADGSWCVEIDCLTLTDCSKFRLLTWLENDVIP